MDTQTALKLYTAAGTAYAIQLIGMPGFYLSQSQMDATDDVVTLTRNCGGGVLGITVAAYLGQSAGPEAKELALKANVAAMCVYAGACIGKVLSGKDSFQAKADAATSAVLLGAGIAALM